MRRTAWCKQWEKGRDGSSTGLRGNGDNNKGKTKTNGLGSHGQLIDCLVSCLDRPRESFENTIQRFISIALALMLFQN